MRIGMMGSARRLAAHAAVVCLAGLLAGFLLSSTRSFAGENEKPKTLYQRVGGYDVIAGIVDEFLNQLRGSKTFERFGGGRGEDSLKRARQLIVDQLCSLSGGPCVYIGRDMKTVHQGLKITAAEWDANIKAMELALDKFKVAGKDKEEFIALIQDTRKDIVEVEEKPKEVKAPGRN
ncbi:MAG TPA: group 1 truncated hemoglobin [Terriglobales bacterium]|nr:group 1 truncated hemoglobin [Terriglobales bacterium]